MSDKEQSQTNFSDLGLSDQVMKVLDVVGYETPTPIQEKTIPHILAGKDIVGQAQTGTGKTAAFALPLLSMIDIKKLKPQVLVLTPTRELAIQVAEAFQKYASSLKGFHVLPIYGGQGYDGQLRRLKRGVHVVVGTPGRLMDHIRRKTLNLDNLSCLILDEADEMLRMGFLDDVTWILEQTPAERQIALFSATMPQAIRRIAKRYLKEPQEITIKAKTATVSTTRQRYWMVAGSHKLDALTRILEAEPFEAILIFVRTKNDAVEVSQKLEARGYASSPLNGDIPQRQRERTIEHLRKGKLNILVATDVAARGLDVDRISHVINYDIPYDTEAYIHRIGRTGRAGKSGEAILFVAPRERRMLHAIEKATKQKIAIMEMPTTDVINNKRIANFKQRISDTLAEEELDFFTQMMEQYRQEHDVPALDIAAALAKLLQGDEPLLLKGELKQHKPKSERSERTKTGRKDHSRTEEKMERYRIEVGHIHEVRPKNIVGAIANEAGIDSAFIGRIEIFDEYSTVDLPEGMPDEVFNFIGKIWVAGQQLKISRQGKSTENLDESPRKRRPERPGKTRKRSSKRKKR